VISLIVSADDVGLHPSFTAGALDAYERGLVTSLSVITASGYWAETVEALRAAGVNEIGVHLTVCDGQPVSDAPLGRLLVEGRFSRPMAAVALLAAGYRSAIRTEWLAQIRRAQDAGFTVTHLDGHKHLHVLPGLAGIAGSVAKATGVLGVRRPMEPGFGPRKRVRAGLALASAVALLGSNRKNPDRCVGIGVSGGLDSERLLAAIAALEPGVTEFLCHPASADDGYPAGPLADGLAWTKEYAADRERRALLDPEARAALEARGVRLLSWGEFCR
jgi:chitin disaccharide deacetylase